MSPLAVRTVGDPTYGAPRIDESFCDTGLYISSVMIRRSVHLNTARSGGVVRNGSSFGSLDDLAGRLEEEDMREIVEKCDGEGDIPSCT